MNDGLRPGDYERRSNSASRREKRPRDDLAAKKTLVRIEAGRRVRAAGALLLAVGVAGVPLPGSGSVRAAASTCRRPSRSP